MGIRILQLVTDKGSYFNAIQSADYYVTNKTADPGTVASIKELGKKVIFSDS